MCFYNIFFVIRDFVFVLERTLVFSKHTFEAKGIGDKLGNNSVNYDYYIRN